MNYSNGACVYHLVAEWQFYFFHLQQSDILKENCDVFIVEFHFDLNVSDLCAIDFV